MALTLVLAVIALITYGYNNCPCKSDAAFAEALTEAERRGYEWIHTHPEKLMTSPRNIALFFMLQEMDRMRPSALFSEMVRRRWVERLLENQRQDGGWLDRWYGFTSTSRWGGVPIADEHTTLLALWAVYQVKYEYATAFGLPPQADSPSGDAAQAVGR